MNTPKISIIIPVYGVEKYIKKCIESIKVQTFLDFECLIVNDGTKDNSIKIAKEVVDTDERFIFLEKENGGQGSARNMGLSYAKGNYIAFIDSDDYVEPLFLQAMHEKIVKENADICVCNLKILKPNGVVENKFVSQIEKYNTTNDPLNVYSYIYNWFCDKLYSSEVFKTLRFDPNVRTFEDAHLAFRIYYQRDIVQVDDFLYNYVQHTGSTSNDIKPSFIMDRVAIKNKQIEFAQEIGLNNQEYLTYLYLKTFVFFSISKIARFSQNYRSDIEKLKAEIDPKFYNLKNISSIVKKDNKVGLSLLLFNRSPQAFRLFARFWFRNHAA